MPGQAERGGNGRRNPLHPRSSPALTGLFLLALVYTLYVASGLLVPITLSVLLSILFFPLVRSLARRGIPRVVSSAMVVSAVLLVVGLAISTLSGPAGEWLRDAPYSIRQLKLEMVQGSDNLDDIQALAKEREGEFPEAVQREMASR